MSVTHQPHCPKCRTIFLEEKTLSDHTTKIDVCPSCRGGWFDAAEMNAVLSCAVGELEVPRNVQKTSRICPRCGVPLSKIAYPETQIEVDLCDECHGVWLDRGEFRGINEARARYQDQDKFAKTEAPPASLKEAAVRFVDRVLVRFLNVG